MQLFLIKPNESEFNVAKGKSFIIAPIDSSIANVD